MKSLSGKTILVAGALGLIGRACVEMCKALGAVVYTADVRGGDFKFNLATSTGRGELFFCLGKQTIHGFVNVTYPGSYSDHLECFMRMTESMCNYMARWQDCPGGAIVNMSSIYGIRGPRMKLYEGLEMRKPTIEYAAVKAAVIGVTKWAATVWAPAVRVNCIAAGGVEDNQHQKFIAAYEAGTPLQSMATPEDIAHSVVYLLTAEHKTGRCLVVDGGRGSW